MALLGSRAVRASPAWCLAGARGGLRVRRYNSRDQLDRQLHELQALANTVDPAHQEHQFLRKSKIVCTIGPKVGNADDIAMLMAAGMNVARFNFSHGEYSWFEEVIGIIRDVKRQKGRSDVAIALDTKGPEIRTGHHALGTPAGDPERMMPLGRSRSNASSAVLNGAISE